MALHPLVLYSQLSNGLDQTNKHFYPSRNSKSDKVQNMFFFFFHFFNRSIFFICDSCLLAYFEGIFLVPDRSYWVGIF